MDHGRFQAFASKKLFVSETDHKLSSKTLTREVRELQATVWVLVQNQSRLQQTPREETKALAAQRTASRTILNPSRHAHLIYSLWANFGSGVIKARLKDWARPAQQTSTLKSFLCGFFFKPSLGAAHWLELSIAASGFSLQVPEEGQVLEKPGSKPSTQVPAPPASLSRC